MAGHSKWENIKRKKAKVDSVRGKQFAVLSKNITIAVKEGGSANPDANPRLRLAVSQAKNHNMPMANIEKAINKSGNNEDGEDITLELYLKGGVCVVAEAIANNRHQLFSDLNTILNKHKVKMAESGSAKYLFNDFEIFEVKQSMKEDEALELGFELSADTYEIYPENTIFFIKKEDGKAALDYMLNNFEVDKFENNSISIPIEVVDCDEEITESNNIVMEKIRNLEGVVNLFHNMKI